MRVGIVGAGTMGRVHGESHREAGHEVVAVYDLRPEAREALARETGARPAESYEDLLGDPAVEVVDICLPTHLHREYVEAAARAGKHVICEKPIALSLADARAMIETCQAARVHLYIAHVVRFFPEYRRARELVLAGEVGRPGIIRTSRMGGFPAGWADWYAQPEQGGTVLVDLVIHDFDWLRWTFGEVERVYAKSLTGRTAERLDYALVTLRLASGAIAHVEGSWAHPGFRYAFEIAGDAGVLEFDSARVQPLVVRPRQAGHGSGPAGVEVPESPLAESPYTTQLRHFARCIRGEEKPVVTAWDAYKALAISLAALESARTGRPVSLGKEG